MKRAVWLGLVLVTIACARPLDLPESPSATHPPRLEAVEPLEGFAGDTITLTGSGFGTDPADVQVEFAGALPVAAKSVADGLLAVTVPLDAADGPVAVRTSHGRATSAKPFTFQGRGMLVDPAVAAEVDLRPRIETALEVDGQLLVMAGEPYLRAAIDQGVFEALPGTALWIGAHGNEVLELVSSLDASCRADLVALSPEPPVEELSRTILVDEGKDCEQPTRFVVAGDDAFVRAGQTLFAVNTLDRHVTKIEPELDRDGGERLTNALAVIDGSRVLAASKQGLWDVRKVGGLWNATLVPLDVTIVSLAVSNGRAFGLSDAGQLVRFNVTDEGITAGTPHALSTVDGVGDARLALSEDGQRLAISAPQRQRIFVYDVSGEGVAALGSVSASEPREIRSASDGRWLVGATGGVLTISDRTGILVDFTEVDSRPKPPTLRRSVLEEEGSVLDWLEIVSGTFNRLRRFEANTLVEEVYYTDPLEPGPPIMETACASGGHDLVLRHGRRELRRIGDAEFPAESNHPFFTAPEGWDEILSIAVSNDGKDVLVTHADGDGTTRLSLLPMDAPWDTLVPTSMDAGLGEPERVIADGNRLVVVGADGCGLFERDAAREGRVVPVGKPLAFPDGYGPMSAALAGNQLVVLTQGGTMGYWRGAHLMSLTDGAAGPSFDGIPPSHSWVGNVAISPSGRAFWWRDQYDAVLGEGTFDPVTGTPAFRRASVRLSPGASELLSDPRGERLWVLDPTGDRLQLVK